MLLLTGKHEHLRIRFHVIDTASYYQVTPILEVVQ